MNAPCTKLPSVLQDILDLASERLAKGETTASVAVKDSIQELYGRFPQPKNCRKLMGAILELVPAFRREVEVQYHTVLMGDHAQYDDWHDEDGNAIGLLLMIEGRLSFYDYLAAASLNQVALYLTQRLTAMAAHPSYTITNL